MKTTTTALAAALYAACVHVSPLVARTVAYWPLAYENGVRTTTSTVFANHGDGGELNAVPSSRQGASWIAGSDYCPQGTNAFPVGYGVYDPVSGTNVVGRTGLYFHKVNLDGYAGALRVADPAALRLTTFTVECFIRMQTGTTLTDWNCIAVMPAQLPANGAPVNYESWGFRVVNNGSLAVRFSKNKGTVAANLAASDNTTVSFNTPGPVYDGKWHHVAFCVDGTTVRTFWDYTHVSTATLPENVWYNSGMDLFIGNTPQTTGPFGGSIAHFRISDEAIDPPSFLHVTRTEMAADEDPDALLHMDFEPPTGLPAAASFFNDAAIGPAPHRYGADLIPCPVSIAQPFSPVYAGLLDETGRASSYCMTNSTRMRASEPVKRYLAWQPPEDVFTNSSFTVECCYKTAGALGQWIPLVRRLGGANVQFNLGFSGGANVGKLTTAVIQGNAAVKSVVDSVRSDDGAWHQAAIVFNREWRKLLLFRDYALVGWADCTDNVLIATDNPIQIGGGYGNDGNFYPYDGAIDNVRITMRALTVGEFLRSDHVTLSGKTLAWVSFDNTLDSAAPAYALTNGVATAEVGGSVPSYAAFQRGDAMRIEDGAGNVLRSGNFAALSFSTGIVKYAANRLLPLIGDQTIEFRVKAHPQKSYAGLISCNVVPDSFNSDTPVWALSTDDASGSALRFRCTTALPGSILRNYGDDTGVVVCDGRWHHVALTISASGKGDSATTTVCLYKDCDATPSWTKTYDGALFYIMGDAPVWLGASQTCFNGQIDELRISRGVLEPDEFLRVGKMGCMLIFR